MKLESVVVDGCCEADCHVQSPQHHTPCRVIYIVLCCFWDIDAVYVEIACHTLSVRHSVINNRSFVSIKIW